VATKGSGGGLNAAAFRRLSSKRGLGTVDMSSLRSTGKGATPSGNYHQLPSTAEKVYSGKAGTGGSGRMNVRFGKDAIKRRRYTGRAR
jgi:hypothetical protein